MTAMNTINICLGHMPFPISFSHYVDIAITPRLYFWPKQMIVVHDNIYGEHGSSLSEYGQLIWLFDHFDEIVSDYDYIRVFQYRRFVASVSGGATCSHPWAKRIKADELQKFDQSFSRYSERELINTTFTFPQTIYGQYKEAHVEEDMINFVKYMRDIGKFTENDQQKFICETTLIPACNMGVFQRSTLYWILSELKTASKFIHSPFYQQRTGYQRRAMGFLLERLNSYLLLRKNPSLPILPNCGNHIIISDDHEIYTTTNIR